ncbi:hypothetical protein [Sphingobacterium athyrii]|uniref:DUF4304 domain-containing protein n=1 Tax=Sphingobacterium athyrii TaxID=2152717 RepID=A0A363NUF6_9SPHI|nr:hypothetical protein [Sphingobacterium athyrii]PUV24397.1 hypothetical protein DCO56_13715 [Sphingobacterium athyrii]
MKPKEIEIEIQKIADPFFKEQGFKYSKKDSGYIKNIGNAAIRYGFSYLERKPDIYYQIYLYITLNEVEDILGKLDGSGIIGVTYVFPQSFFIDREEYVNKNPKFLIADDKDVSEFTTAFVNDYKNEIKDFITDIIKPEKMLEFLLSEIDTGKRYANNIDVLLRALILLKILKDPNFEIRLNEFRNKVSDYAANIKEQYLDLFNRLVKGAY